MKKWKILLIEAGENPTFESDIPGFGLSLPGRELDWKFEANRSDKSCLGMEEGACPIFQGRVLGGTSTINKMHYLRGNKADYDEWEELGNDGWNYDKVLQYFKKSEKLDNDFTLYKESDFDEIFDELKAMAGKDDRKVHKISKMVVGKYHSKAGMMPVNHYAYDHSLERLKKGLCGAAEEVGIPYLTDVNGKSQIGFVRAMGSINEGSRGNTAKGFLTPVKTRKNLVVVKDATVLKIIFDGKQATGVKYIKAKKTVTVEAKKEVIVSAGVINSPRLLLLSGVGCKEKLQSVGVKVVQDLSGVGQNLQTHLSFFGLGVALDKNNSTSTSHLQKLDRMYQFISRGTGAYGNVGLNDVVGFVDTRNDTGIPDVQYLHYLNQIRDYYTFNELLISLKVRNEIRDQYSKAYAKSNVLLMCPTLLRPKSRGSVTLTGPTFYHPLEITSGFLEEREDVETLLRGIEAAVRLIESETFNEFEPEILKLDIPKCRYFAFRSDEYWECLIRHLATSMHDAGGTCKMGPEYDSTAVVDSRLKVHGLKGLRVADASIMPVIVRGSVSIASTMIGEKVSDMIKEEWKEVKHVEL